MYHIAEARIREALSRYLQEQGIAGVAAPVERPRNAGRGEVSTPVAFELAKRLRRSPRQIAEEMAGALRGLPGVAKVEAAGAGYVNFYLDRAAYFAESAAGAGRQRAEPRGPKCIVEHTNINPNKAAHIGHLRNAALGDALVRLLRRAGRRVEVQNYIDNTGVQVADVVVGFQQLEKKTPAQAQQLARQPRFDYFCWDLYARVTNFFEEDAARLKLREQALAAIEQGRGETAELAEIVSEAIVRCHLATMERLGIEYDVLPRESEILRLKFWEEAFELLKKRQAIRLATEGKNRGCWVMGLGAEEGGSGSADDEAKVIVRSNGTVTYVGKDIAYQMWKFGLLERDFGYRRFYRYPSGHVAWVSAASGAEPDAPAFGHGREVFNVIDARQAYLQNVVAAGLRALGFEEEAGRSVHFSYEVVALSPRCAAELGYALSEEEAKKPYVEVSGRKGQGVKADELLDRLEAAARAEVDARHPQETEGERGRIAHAIAIGALRYFLLKYTRTSVIAFDFKDALSFDGETGPYCQYAVVRARNIIRKAAEEISGFRAEWLDEPVDREAAARLFSGPGGDEFWRLALLAGSLDYAAGAALEAQEPAFVAKYAFELAQEFNLFYHRHRVLAEENAAKRKFLLQLSRLVERQLSGALELLGITAPEKM